MKSTKKKAKSIVVEIIEDEKILLKNLGDAFEEEGMKVIRAEQGDQGLSLALKKHPNVILLDILMPVMDGLTMLRKLREDKWGKDAMVVILSNLTDADAMRESMQNHATYYLVKADWGLKTIVEKVKQLMAEKGVIS